MGAYLGVIIGTIDDRIEHREELSGRSLADSISFIAEDEKSPCDLLTEFIYEDFVKAR